MTTIDDPFALPSESGVAHRADVLSRGRYRLPRRDGTKKPYGWMRVSNLVSAYSDQFGLRMWELGEVIQGMTMDPALYAAACSAGLPAMDQDARREWVEQFVEHAKEASGGNHGSKHGSQRHAAVETHHAGLPTGHLSPATRRDLALYASALVRNRLRAVEGMQERRVLVEELEVVGTLDNVVEDLATGTLRIGDLKTQKRFWTWLEIKAQLACYAHGNAVWDAATGTWADMPPVDREVGHVLWMPRETEDSEPRVDVYGVDLVSGWATARRAYGVVQDRAAARSRHSNGAWLWPAPAASVTEQYAARFAACETMAEGRALVAEAMKAGAWSVVLADCAKAARDRIAVPA